MKYETELVKLGTFDISGKMRVSDPCYRPETWCSGVLDTRPGRWEAAVLVLDSSTTGGWGDRVAVIAVKHEYCELPLSTDTINKSLHNMYLCGWKIADFEVGVDSGQAGFYDEDKFVARNGGDDDDWYDMVCDITLSEQSAGVFDDGAVSSSGYGDGGYSCVYHTDTNNKVDFAYIVFIMNEENEEGDC